MHDLLNSAISDDSETYSLQAFSNEFFVHQCTIHILTGFLQTVVFVF